MLYPENEIDNVNIVKFKNKGSKKIVIQWVQKNCNHKYKFAAVIEKGFTRLLVQFRNLGPAEQHLEAILVR